MASLRLGGLGEVVVADDWGGDKGSMGWERAEEAGRDGRYG
jgi:hypothetical protein